MKHKGERILLREWQHDEAEAIHFWLGDLRVTRFLAWAPGSFQGSCEHLRQCVEHQNRPERRQFFLSIERLSNGLVLGSAGCEWSQEASDRLDVASGYFLAHAYWGLGYATEAARLVLDLAFRYLGGEAARASCDERNPASVRVLEKCGLTRQPT